MAFTSGVTESLQYAAGQSAKKADVPDNSPMHYAYFDYTHSDGAGVGEGNLTILPSGPIKIYPSLSRVVSSAMVSTADLHIGHRAYTQADGTTVAEDNNAFVDDLDAGSAQDVAWSLPAVPTNYETREGLTIYFEVDTANIEDTDTITGWVAYTKT